MLANLFWQNMLLNIVQPLSGELRANFATMAGFIETRIVDVNLCKCSLSLVWECVHFEKQLRVPDLSAAGSSHYRLYRSTEMSYGTCLKGQLECHDVGDPMIMKSRKMHCLYNEQLLTKTSQGRSHKRVMWHCHGNMMYAFSNSSKGCYHTLDANTGK